MAVDLGAVDSEFNAAGIDLNDDFHTLRSSQVDIIVQLAKSQGYHKPKFANGSTGRCYFEALQRAYNKRGETPRPEGRGST
jgi:hypothetical protein